MIHIHHDVVTARSSIHNCRSIPVLVVVLLVFLITILQLVDTISCFTYHERIPPFPSRFGTTRTTPYHPQQQQQQPQPLDPDQHLVSSISSFSDMRLSSTTQTTTLIRSTTSAAAAATLDDTTSQRKRIFRLPTINTVEYNRITRRMESTYKDHSYWVKHRSNDRLFHHMRTMPKSIIYQTIRQPVRYITYLSTCLVIWNCLVLLTNASMATSDLPHRVASLLGLFSKKLVLLRIPIDPLVITSPMLGLLLVFRTNSCYKRYEEALINWTKTKSQSRNIIRMAKSMKSSVQRQQPASNQSNESVTAEKQKQRNELVHLGLCVWLFARTMKRQLSHPEDDEIAYRNEIDSCLSLPSLYRKQLLLQVQHRPNYALQYLSDAIEHLSNIPNIRKNEIHAAVTTFEQCLGSNERILTSPVPLFYTRWTSRFLFLWIAFCPFALYSYVINPAALLSTLSTTSLISMGQIFIRSSILIPMMYSISMFLFGIDEIAMQCEEPFSILPQQDYCDEIYSDCNEIANYDYYNENDTAITVTTNMDEIVEHTTENQGSVHMNSISTEMSRLPKIKHIDTIESDSATPPPPEHVTNHGDPIIQTQRL